MFLVTVWQSKTIKDVSNSNILEKYVVLAADHVAPPYSLVRHDSVFTGRLKNQAKDQSALC